MVEEANCLACFATSGLFTVPTLKGVNQWQVQDKKPFDVRYLVDTHQQQSLHDNAIKLAEAWKQSPHMVMALRNHLLLPEHMSKHKVAVKLALTLGLSLMLAREIYFAEKSRCQDANEISPTSDSDAGYIIYTTNRNSITSFCVLP